MPKLDLHAASFWPFAGDRTAAFKAVVQESTAAEEPLMDHGPGHKLLQSLIRLPKRGMALKILLNSCKVFPVSDLLFFFRRSLCCRWRVGILCQPLTQPLAKHRQSQGLRRRQPIGLCALPLGHSFGGWRGCSRSSKKLRAEVAVQTWRRAAGGGK